MLNIEKYKDDINLMKVTVNQNTGKLTMYGCPEIMRAFGNNQFYVREILKWLAEEYKEPLLTDSEREYLKFVLKPFHKRIEFVTKKEGSENETINFVYDTDSESWLPSFPKETMFKNLRSYDCYTLEELGITYDD